MRASLRFPPLLVVVVAVAGACEQTRTSCGEQVGGSGPPMIATREGELCESVRLRFAEALSRMQDLPPERTALLRDATWGWEDAGSLDGFVRRVREDGGEELAAAASRAVEDVRAHGSRPVRAGCEADERCRVKAAAVGARVALDDATQILLAMRSKRAETERWTDPNRHHGGD